MLVFDEESFKLCYRQTPEEAGVQGPVLKVAQRETFVYKVWSGPKNDWRLSEQEVAKVIIAVTTVLNEPPRDLLQVACLTRLEMHSAL